LERCQRGRMGRPAKALSGFNRTVGSNPTLSARVSRWLVLPLILSGLFVLIEPSPVSACQTSYTAQRGDSWWLIAEKHGLTLTRVLKLNGAKTSSKILVGDAVCVAVASAKPKQEAVRYTPKEVIQIIREEWPDDLEERAIQIARRESKLNPRAIGIPNDCCYGLFQIYYRWHKSWLPSVGVENSSQLLDPRLNARAAFRMYQRNNGWGPWQ
jgi:LysM repeat protein